MKPFYRIFPLFCAISSFAKYFTMKKFLWNIPVCEHLIITLYHVQLLPQQQSSSRPIDMMNAQNILKSEKQKIINIWLMGIIHMWF
jgi:hypothetical protein